MSTLTQNDTDEDFANILIGHRIVEAEMGRYDIGNRWGDHAEGKLVLDDGTILYLTGNDGGCGCNAGCYPLSKVSAVNNVITNARIQRSPSGDDEEGEGVYRIFVFAESTEITVAEFEGSDGNGFYGTGFSVQVVRANS